jgi:galacturonokinase
MFEQRIQKLKDSLCEKYPNIGDNIYAVVSPLRICPLGAHVDHQGGMVTGMPVGAPNILVFAPTDSPQVKIHSNNFDGEVNFDLSQEITKSDLLWENYVRGAAKAIQSKYPLTKGFVGIISGSTPIGGLSSSASVGVAYLLALEKSNNLEITREENIRLDKNIENDFLGLKNGILDQSIILMGNNTSLTFLDCKQMEFKQVQQTTPQDEYEIIVAYSGLTKSLVNSSDYNNRVTECQEAARLLCENAGIKTEATPKLGDIPFEIWQQYENQLPTPLDRRAKHFFTEVQRVQDGIKYWETGDINNFGRLINESCESSITNYESGSPQLISLQKLLKSCKGVYGSRFSGAGFRGSCIGLVNPKYKDEIVELINVQYPKLHPEVGSDYRILFTKQLDGAQVYSI